MLNSNLIPASKAIKLLALIQIIQEVVIVEDQELIEGHLYAHVMDTYSLDDFNYVLDILKESGTIQVNNHCISKG